MSELFLSLQAFLLVAALSLDAFLASFAYGTSKIKIPAKSVLVLAGVCSGVLGMALAVGRLIGRFIPQMVTVYLSFFILLGLALAKFFDFAIQQWIRRKHTATPKTEFKILNYHFYLQLMSDCTKADLDGSQELSPHEAVALAISLSLDGLAAGFGAGLATAHAMEMVLFSLLLHAVAVPLGCFCGNAAAKTKLNVAWVSGAVLLLLAITKLL